MWIPPQTAPSTRNNLKDLMNYRYSRSSQQFAHRSSTPLSNEAIAYFTPSVMAESAHESRGERYTYIPTIAVIDGLRAEGFEPYEVRQTKTRLADRREFTKHMVRMRHVSEVGTQRDEAGEIILLNSHDGTSSYQLMSGFFRFVCSNGLIAGDVCEDIRVRHSGNVVDNVIEGATRVLDNLHLAEERIAEYKSITLSNDEQREFARSALMLKYEPENTPIVPSSVLHPRRNEDRANDLFTVFNRVQEHLIDGGVRGRSTTGRPMTTRPVTGVNENIRLNRSLWALADSMARIKTGVAA